MSTVTISRSSGPVLGLYFPPSKGVEGPILSKPPAPAKSLDQRIKALPQLFVKPWAVLKSPFSRKPRITARHLFEEEEKLRRTHHLRRTAVRRAVAEETFTRKSVREMRMLDLAQTGAGTSLPGIALATARSVQEVAQAERNLLTEKIEECVALLNVLRQEQDDMDLCLAEAHQQVAHLQTVLKEHEIQESDLVQPDIPPTPPSSPPSTTCSFTELPPYSAVASVAESG